jgi:hypothetical protein
MATTITTRSASRTAIDSCGSGRGPLRPSDRDCAQYKVENPNAKPALGCEGR